MPIKKIILIVIKKHSVKQQTGCFFIFKLTIVFIYKWNNYDRIKMYDKSSWNIAGTKSTIVEAIRGT